MSRLAVFSFASPGALDDEEAGMGNEVRTVMLALVLQAALMVLVVGGAAVTTLYRERRLRTRPPLES